MKTKLKKRWISILSNSRRLGMRRESMDMYFLCLNILLEKSRSISWKRRAEKKYWFQVSVFLWRRKKVDPDSAYGALLKGLRDVMRNCIQSGPCRTNESEPYTFMWTPGSIYFSCPHSQTDSEPRRFAKGESGIKCRNMGKIHIAHHLIPTFFPSLIFDGKKSCQKASKRWGKRRKKIPEKKEKKTRNTCIKYPHSQTQNDISPHIFYDRHK